MGVVMMARHVKIIATACNTRDLAIFRNIKISASVGMIMESVIMIMAFSRCYEISFFYFKR